MIERSSSRLLGALALCSLVTLAYASYGDRLPEFHDCVSACTSENCHNPFLYADANTHKSSRIPVHLKALLWTCSSNCDYICQHIITSERLSLIPPIHNPIVQYHGKWPFYRFFGIQEPASVLFSLFNFLAHWYGLSSLHSEISPRYSLLKYYLLFGYFGLASWTFSMIFHTRDFPLTEELDYFGAGASVLYGLYYSLVRIFRLDRASPRNQTILRLWTGLCIMLYLAHVSYLTLWQWDYTYNMAANVAVGIIQNLFWTGFSITRYSRSWKGWQAWPGMIIAWIVLAMSLELFDFAPWIGVLDAHSLWHAGTVVPTIWWYRFLVRDAKEDSARERLKA